MTGQDVPSRKRLITGKNGPRIRVTPQDGPSTKRLITGQYGPGIRVTGQDGPNTKRLITGQYGPGIEVTGQDGPGMKRLTKRNKNGHNGANEILERYLQKSRRIKIEEAEQGKVSETVTLASQVAAYDSRDACM